MNDTVTEVKERPILFSTPMVKAILEGRKTVTRRVVKLPPDFDGETIYPNPPFGIKYQKTDSTVWRLASPYGFTGDILWVRETWRPFLKGSDTPPGYWNVFEFKAGGDALCPLVYELKFDDYLINGKWKPSIHMPRAACRLRLEIQSIRVERLHDITEEDAIREGIEVKNDLRYHDRYDMTGYRDYGPPAKDGLPYWFGNAKDSFESLWTKINGAESWNANPWVWRIEFKRINQ